MYKKMTPQEVYEAYRDAPSWQKPLPDEWAPPPATWEAVSERDKAFYAWVALKVNSISAEFREDER